MEDIKEQEKDRHGPEKHTLQPKIDEQRLPTYIWKQYGMKKFFIRYFTWMNPQKIPYKHYYIEGPEEDDDRIEDGEKVEISGSCGRRIRFEFRPYPLKGETDPYLDKDTFNISLQPHNDSHHTFTDFIMTEDRWKRLNIVSSATNFSFCLRNSEHLVNYIAFAKWNSNQMQMKNDLREYFDDSLDKESRKFTALLPKELKATEEKNMEDSQKKLFDKLEGSIEFDKKMTVEEFKKLDAQKKTKDDYNIIFAGPTGVGKSTLINLAFNKTVCKTDVDTSSSVTREVAILSGMYMCKDKEEIRVNIFDTMGVCDTYLDNDEVIQDLLDAIDTDKSKVVIVCSGKIKREHKAAITRFLKDLKYEKDKNKNNFIFLYHKSEGMKMKARNQGLQEMGEQLGVDIAHKITFSVPDGESGDRFDRSYRTGECTGFNIESYDKDCLHTFKVLTDRILPQASDDYMEKKLKKNQEKEE